MDYIAILNLVAALAERAPHLVEEVKAVITAFTDHQDAAVSSHATALVAGLDGGSPAA